MQKLLALLPIVALAACVGNQDIVDEDDTGRALAGGAIGAGAGEIISDDPIAGAAIGAGTGVIADDI